MSGRIILLALVLILPVVILGRQTEHSRTKRSLSGYNKPQKNARNANSNTKPHLRLRNVPPESLYLSVGESQVLECEAGGNPPPTIHWLKNGKRLHQNFLDTNEVEDGVYESEPLLGLSFTRSRLFIDCATEQDRGDYTCVAETAYYRTSTNTKVEILNRNKIADDIFCLTKKSYGVPARINMWTHTRLELMRSNVQLFCRVEGEPEPMVEWRNQNDELIRDGNKYKILDNGDLIIHNIEWNDMGNYECVSKNVHGTDATSTFLYPTKPEK